jgi:hypothetical protein
LENICLSTTLSTIKHALSDLMFSCGKVWLLRNAVPTVAGPRRRTVSDAVGHYLTKTV